MIVLTSALLLRWYGSGFLGDQAQIDQILDLFFRLQWMLRLPVETETKTASYTEYTICQW